jgi:cell division septal protein FtsQ
MLQKRRIILQSPRLIQKKKRQSIIKLSLFGAFIMALCIGFYIFMKLPFLNVQDINVSGTEALDANDIKTKAKEFLSGTVYVIIPKSNLFFYSKDELQSTLPALFPRIKNISLDLENNILNIKVVEKKASALWCNETDCYFMDDLGNIFSKSPDFNGSVYKKFYGGIEGEAIGKNFLDKETLEKIKSIYETFDSYKVIISRVEVISPKEVKLRSIYNVEFLINLEKETTETMDNIDTILTAERFVDSLPMLKGIEYIDFRFGSKVFFKKGS